MTDVRTLGQRPRQPPFRLDSGLWWIIDAVFATHLDHVPPTATTSSSGPHERQRYLFATHVDQPPPTAHENQREGIGIVTALAVFVITQGGFVASSIRDAKTGPKLWALFGIYIVLFSLAFLGLQVVLRWTTSRNGSRSRMFDDVTIAYARWVMFSGIVVLLLLSLLAYFNLLPGQPTRYDFEGELTSTTVFASDFSKTVSADASLRERSKEVMDAWIKRLAQTPESERVLLLRQNQSFRRDYFPVYADLLINDDDFTIAERFAFLAKESGPPLQTVGSFGDFYLPTYRQAPFEPAGDGRLQSRRLRLPAPNQGEQLIVLLVVHVKPGKNFPATPQGFDCRLRVVPREKQSG